MSVINIDALISWMRWSPVIWDKRNKCHSNRSIVDKCWKDIAQKLHSDENALRKKWKYLREQFCVELGKISQPYSGEEGPNTESKWPHFKSLLFLKDVVKPRLPNVAGNNLFITVPVDPTNFVDGVDDPVEEQGVAINRSNPENSSEGSLEDCESTVISSSSRLQKESTFLPLPRKRSYPDETETIPDPKKSKVLDSKTLNLNMDDEDMLFFRSLLPHVKNVQSAQKLLLRTKILDLVSRFAYPQSLPNHSSRAYSPHSDDQSKPTPNMSPHKSLTTDSD